MSAAPSIKNLLLSIKRRERQLAQAKADGSYLGMSVAYFQKKLDGDVMLLNRIADEYAANWLREEPLNEQP